MIVTKINAGLGNQMFQYAFGYAAALDNNSYLLQDIGHYIYRDKLQIHPRAYKLALYNTRFNKTFTLPIDGLVNILAKKGVSCNTLRDKYIKYFSNLTYVKDDNIECHNVSDNCYLSGYWQSDLFFNKYADDIRNEFKLNIELNEHNRLLLNEIQNSRKAVSVHFRRGDYCSTDHLDSNYYIMALAYLSDILKIHDLRLFVFSDDPQLARECFKNSLPNDFVITYVDINDEHNGHFDLELMRYCNHHIIANSSFSWWGAWLCEHSDKIVIAPKLSYDKQLLFARPCKNWVVL